MQASNNLISACRVCTWPLGSHCCRSLLARQNRASTMRAECQNREPAAWRAATSKSPSPAASYEALGCGRSTLSLPLSALCSMLECDPPGSARSSRKAEHMSHNPNPGTKMVNPEPCKELERRPQPFPAGTAPY